VISVRLQGGKRAFPP